MQMSASPGVIRRTGEDSRWLPTVIFCHIIADVTSCVTRCKEAFNIERPKLRIDTDERTLDIMGLVVDYREDGCVSVWGGESYFEGVRMGNFLCESVDSVISSIDPQPWHHS